MRRFDRRVYSDERLLYPPSGADRRARDCSSASPGTKRSISPRRGCRRRRTRLGGEAVLPYYYGGSNGLLTNEFEDARLFRRFGASRLARTVCAAPTGAAATAMYGKMAGVAYPDYADARLIVVWGCNPSASGIHLVSHIKQAQKHGARLVVIDPRRTPLARQADLHLAVRPGTDVVVALALIRELFARGYADDGVPRRAHDRRRRAARRPPRRGRSRAPPPKPGVSATDLATLVEWYGERVARRDSLRLGPGAQPQRRRGDDGDPGAAGGGRQVRRPRRRLHDEQLGRVEHRQPSS